MTQDSNSIQIHADFVKELLIPLSTFVEQLQDLEDMFSELAQILSMKQISLYRVADDGSYEVVSAYGSSSFQQGVRPTIKNMNLYIAWKHGRTSCLPLPHFWDNIVVPVGMDNFYLAAGDSRHAREIARIENSLFELVASVIANALRSMRLIEQANTDKLTGLLNRNALDKYIFEGKNPFDRQLSEPKAVCMMDIDFFKRFNDTYGHHIGDQVLHHVAQLAKQYFGPDNRVYRFWWEEMTFVIHACQDGMLSYVDGFRKILAETPLLYDDISYSVTASVGVHIFTSDENNQKDAKFHALKFADLALYSAKEAGRNRTVIYVN